MLWQCSLAVLWSGQHQCWRCPGTAAQARDWAPQLLAVLVVAAWMSTTVPAPASSVDRTLGVLPWLCAPKRVWPIALKVQRSRQPTKLRTLRRQPKTRCKEPRKKPATSCPGSRRRLKTRLTVRPGKRREMQKKQAARLRVPAGIWRGMLEAQLATFAATLTTLQ